MILVTGATGHVGSELIPLLLNQGLPVRALTRDASKLAHWGDRIQPAVGSFEQPETLAAAMQGVKKLFLMTNELGSEHVQAAMEAAKQADVRQVVYLSSLGAGDTTLLLGKWHHDREAAIRASGLAWTFLRPGYFMSNTLMWADTIKTQGAVYSPGGQGQTAPIDPQDIAAVAALALTQSGHEGQIYTLTGEEFLTIGEQVEIIARLLDKPLRYVDVPPEAAHEAMLKQGMPPLLAEAVTQVYGRISGSQVAQSTDTFAKVVGRKPRVFEAWCRDHIAAFQ